jgi:hypothetical protein
VKTRVKFFVDLIVTIAAFHGSQSFGMGKFFYIGIGMTSDTLQLLVDGPGKFLQINKKRAGLALSLHRQLLIRMT